jgi:hypothetical protein
VGLTSLRSEELRHGAAACSSSRDVGPATLKFGGNIMGEDTKNYKVQITIAIISLVGVIGAAIFGNWDKIFPVDNPARPPEIMRETQKPQKNVENQNAELFQITVYYFPTRKESALELSNFLTKQGYLANLQPASSYPPLEKERNTPSYIYFNKDDFTRVMEIKRMMEKNLGHTVNAYKYDQPMSAPLSMTLVLTETEK